MWTSLRKEIDVIPLLSQVYFGCHPEKQKLFTMLEPKADLNRRIHHRWSDERETNQKRHFSTNRSECGVTRCMDTPKNVSKGTARMWTVNMLARSVTKWNKAFGKGWHDSSFTSIKLFLGDILRTANLDSSRTHPLLQILVPFPVWRVAGIMQKGRSECAHLSWAIKTLSCHEFGLATIGGHPLRPSTAPARISVARERSQLWRAQHLHYDPGWSNPRGATPCNAANDQNVVSNGSLHSARGRRSKNALRKESFLRATSSRRRWKTLHD